MCIVCLKAICKIVKNDCYCCHVYLCLSLCLPTCLSICLSTWSNSAPTEWIFIKFDIWGFFILFLFIIIIIIIVAPWMLL